MPNMCGLTPWSSLAPPSPSPKAAPFFPHSALLLLLLSASTLTLPLSEARRFHPQARSDLLLDPFLLFTPTRLFVFGDSQVDVGNNNYISTNIRANIPPYGKDMFPASGRFSNGKLITDFLADKLHIRSPPPFLANCSDIRHGVNFASAGAGILDSTDVNRTIPLSQQLKSFLSFIKEKRISPRALSKAVFLVNIGANDLTNGPQNLTLIPAYLAQMAQGLVGFYQVLISNGARRFIHISIGPVGCVPLARAVKNLLTGCDDGINALAGAANAALLQGVAALRNATDSRVNKQIRFVIFDQLSAGLEIRSNLTQYGFESSNACCGAPPPINGLVGCGHNLTVGGVTLTATVCNNTGSYMFWDNFHPSQKAYGLMANFLWTGARFTHPTLGAKWLAR